MTNEELQSVLDFPQEVRNGRGPLILRRAPRDQVREKDWTERLMASFDGWRDLVGLDVAEEIQLEVPIAPRQRREPHTVRADAIVRHCNGDLTIVEAKISSSPCDICGAIGQLIYYKTLTELYWDARVVRLVCATRYLPPLILETVMNVCAPVCFVKATFNPDGTADFDGIVPKYLANA